MEKLGRRDGGAYCRAPQRCRDRLLFLLRHRDETCVLVLEVIANHAYDKSRFCAVRRSMKRRSKGHRSPV